MKLHSIAANQTEVTLSNGDVVFFSYQTPVAANVNGRFYRTDEHFSRTTSKHVNQWLDGRHAEVKPQSWFNDLTK